jgi:hypothetical protein
MSVRYPMQTYCWSSPSLPTKLACALNPNSVFSGFIEPCCVGEFIGMGHCLSRLEQMLDPSQERFEAIPEKNEQVSCHQESEQADENHVED